ncbi:MAG TPA: SAM-dependent methyltransferase [Pseudomonadales bacterium]|nr:SAM-dependent methyltransferase [Pseudomonadales bacterium]
MQTLPVFLDVKHKPCLLVGDGELAQRKRRLLDKAGAVVIQVSDRFAEENLENVVLVIAASLDGALNERVSLAARARNILVNVVDQPALCTFIFPSIVERGPITVAVSSGGNAPVLTRLLRARIETLLPASLGEFARRVGVFRKQASNRLPDIKQRLRFWDQLLQRQLIGADSNLQTLMDDNAFEQRLESFIAGTANGQVSIVGTGTGDPDLLTFKALRCLQGCDVVIFDQDVSPVIVNLARRDARQIVLQGHEDIFTVLEEEVDRGAYVVFLKSGDPLSYRDLPLLLARLQGANVPYDIVPGIIDQQAGANIYAT